MKYSIAERVMWCMMASRCAVSLKTEREEWNAKKLKKSAHRHFHKIVEDTPFIGTIFENKLRMNLTGGGLWLSFYLAAAELYGTSSKDGITPEMYGRMCEYAIQVPLMMKMYKRKNPFTHEFIEGMAAKTEKANALPYDKEYNWRGEVIKGESADELTYVYYTCGLCALAKRLKLTELLPYMCKTDYITIEQAMGAKLHRDRTLANGDSCCYYYCTKPASEAERKWQAEHPEGTFKSI